jgi:hypothetical protein
MTRVGEELKVRRRERQQPALRAKAAGTITMVHRNIFLDKKVRGNERKKCEEGDVSKR